MKRVICFVFALFLVSFVFAGIEDNFERLTYYAEEYEIGNINYPQLIIGTSFVREKLNEEFGMVSKFEGGMLNEDEIERVLGEPDEMTRWVWVEGEDREKKLDEEVPVWRRIVFDGNKIQIRLEAYPSIFSKKKFMESSDFLDELDGKIIYRLHFNFEFKQESDKIDFSEEIDEIGDLAVEFSENPSSANAEELAEKSVGVEKLTNEWLRESGEDCEDIMIDIFGSENQREVQSILVWEIEFIEGEDFDSSLRLEMCEECEWNWIEFNLDLRTRGFFNGKGHFEDSYEKMKLLSVEEIKREIERNFDNAGNALSEGDFELAMSLFDEIRSLNHAWNEKANHVWEEIESQFEFREELMSEEERREWHDNYGWIKLDQERKRAEEDLRGKNFLERKQFYFELLSGLEKRDYTFKEKSWEKRLFEDFVKIDREVCDNGKDDNSDGNIDCSDSMCGGSICGKSNGGNLTVDLFCIEGECRARDDVIVEGVCGNHICEEGESISCAEDCFVCMQHPAIDCDGRVVFGGEDENGCPLPPICVEEEFCEMDSDCQFLCGEGKCVEGDCKVEKLDECEEGCFDGEENVAKCEDGSRIVLEICDGGVWEETGLECEVEEVVEEEVVREDECETVTDCGGENDVCSNGKCVALPSKVEEEEEEVIEEIIEEIEEELEEVEEEIAPLSVPQNPELEDKEEKVNEEESIENLVEDNEAGITGNVIFSFFSFLTNFKITGAVVDGDGDLGDSVSVDSNEEEGHIEVAVSEEDSTEEPELVNEEPESVSEEETYSDEEPYFEEEGVIDDNFREEEYIEDNRWEEEEDHRREEEEDRRREEERRMEEEQEQREEEMRERCEFDCERPCVEDCIRNNCGEKMDCDVDRERKVCEDECEPEVSCVEKCSEGGDWWKDYEKEHVIENGVFNVGGHCRVLDGRSEGGIWFGGWGEPFEDIQRIKDKYYDDGHEDWCKRELLNLLELRKEFEKGFDDEFLVWFFEKYLANSAEDWESSQSGIYELYWNNVDNLRRMVYSMQCMDESELFEDFELINISYESEYGKLEYWEELKEVDVSELDGGMKGEFSDEKVRIVSPYMRTWIFPSKEFIKYEMRKAMENGEFPGSPEDKMERGNEEGLTAEEKEIAMENKKLMRIIRKLSEKYDGSLDLAVQFKDGEEIVFNVYVEVPPRDESGETYVEGIFEMTPMLPEEIPGEDARVEVDFNLIYDFIYENEKEMRGEEIQSPPWDERRRDFSIKGMIDGIKMYFKVREIVNSAEYYPEDARGEIKDLFWEVVKMMRDEDEKDRHMEEVEGEMDEMSDEKVEEMFTR